VRSPTTTRGNVYLAGIYEGSTPLVLADETLAPISSTATAFVMKRTVDCGRGWAKTVPASRADAWLYVQNLAL
jgi:hypothetical protein